MPPPLNEVVRHLRSALLRHDEAELTDGQLLGRFIEQRDEAMVVALVRRHGPMVWGVCRRLLGNHHDAEDAFQATFLVLMRKAGSIRQRERVGNWLYGVAYQTALKARALRAKRRTRERQGTDMPEPEAPGPEAWHELQAVLDQELIRLPEMYRTPIVLCDLEGKTRKEVARRLGLPEGTLAGRLTRGRALLAKRLARHGLAVTGGALGTILTRAGVSAAVLPTLVLSSTIEALTTAAGGKTLAAGMVPDPVIVLTEGVMKAMLLSRLKQALGVCLALSVLTLGSVFGYRTFAAAKAAPPPATDRLADTLILLDKQWWEAASRHDVDTLGKILADDWVGVSSKGPQHDWNRATSLEHYRRTRYVEVQFLTTRRVVRLDAGTAMMSYEVKWRAEDKTGGHDRIVHCWVQRDGGWFVRYTERVNLRDATPPQAEPTQLDSGSAAKGKLSVRASSSWQVSIPARAFDGRRDTDWNAGTYAPAWIEADLGAPTPLSGITLIPAQDIPGATTHEVWLSNQPIGNDRKGARLVHTFKGETHNAQRLAWDFPKDQSARYVQVRTTQSPTWIAWWEVEIRVRKQGKVQVLSLDPAVQLTKQPAARADETTWGKVLDKPAAYAGLQAGIGIRPGDKRTFKAGESIDLVLKARNVGKAPVTISYYKGSPLFGFRVTDAGGKPVKVLGGVRVEDMPELGKAPWQQQTLKPGEEVELGSLRLDLVSPKGNLNDYPRSLIANPAIPAVPGKYKLSYRGVRVNWESPESKSRLGTIGITLPVTLSTGLIEIEIKE